MQTVQLKKGQVHRKNDGTEFTAPYAGVFVDDSKAPKYKGFNSDNGAVYNWSTPNELTEDATTTRRGFEREMLAGQSNGRTLDGYAMRQTIEAYNRLYNSVYENQLLFGTTSLRLNPNGIIENIDTYNVIGEENE